MDILTGNELTSGGTVYLDAADRWVADLQAARLFSPEEAATRDAALAAATSAGRIISLDIEEITLENGQIVPKRLRARIRAAGPTAPLAWTGQDHGRQSLDGDGNVSL